MNIYHKYDEKIIYLRMTMRHVKKNLLFEKKSKRCFRK